MQTKNLIHRVAEMARPICERAGVVLWDVEFAREGGQYLLTVTIDREEGVGIDQCEAVSRALDPLLDAPEFDSLPAYTLCVSSAGLSRRLRLPAHFAACMGRAVELHFYRPIDGSKTVVGTLTGYDEGRVTLETDGVRRIYEPADLADVRLAVTF